MSERHKQLILIGSIAAFAFLVAIELEAFRLHIGGPTAALGHDLVFGPKRGRVLWAAAALSMVGLKRRQVLTWVAFGATIDVVFFLGRLVAGTRLTFGNGALYLMAALAIRTWVATEGEERFEALRGVTLGFLLIMASKIGDTWLLITAHTRPRVLDQYVQTADHALGNPSWWMGQLVEAGGPPVHWLLSTVYIDLPVGALVVAVYQLRKGWPSHHLIRTFLLIGLVGPLFYLLFPVVGPVYAFGHLGNGFELANLWPHISRVDMAPGSFTFDTLTPRNCMPSLHTAWVVAIFVHSRSGPRWLRVFGATWMTCTLMATLGFGYHYGVDLLAGVVFSLTIEAALRDPERGWGWFRWRLVLGGSTAVGGLLFSYRYLSVQLATDPELSGVLLVGVMAAMITAFYATFFAKPGTALAEWGQREPGTARPAGATPLGA
ncbi:phosphatase PAP2 family protein [Aquihabitans sp. G128]|uniref:phosphatase PAP2 family protein n=1 Tax=Aquihabitans sp. G128 TaxID=2849779 RepID=UPI001C20FAB4|nr:phosphatase PAP2 family protein [Aquihabitans sp. G128]QXC59403.1 phosphatase PAP2 family protein [Aquihabitans sp. G128]